MDYLHGVSPIISNEKKGKHRPIGKCFPLGVVVYEAPVQPFAVLNDRECAWSTTGADSFDLTKPTNYSTFE